LQEHHPNIKNSEKRNHLMKKFKSALVFASAALLVAPLAACASGEAEVDDAATDVTETVEVEEVVLGDILIGVGLPTTGGSAVLGEPMTAGIEMAVAEINAAGGILGGQITISQVETGADDAAALNSFNRLVSESPSAIIGYPISTQGFAIMTQIERSGIPTILGGTNSKLAAAGEWAFSMTSSDAITSRAAAEFAANSLGYTKIGLLREAGELGTGASEVVTAAAADLGLEIVTEQIFQSGDVDLSSQANALAAADIEMLFVYGQQADYIVVSNALATAGAKLPTFVAGLQPGTYASLNYDGFGTIYNRNQCIPSAAESGSLAEWSDAYEAEFGSVPTEYAAIAYDGIMVLAAAIEQAQSTDPAAIKTALDALPLMQGVCGPHIATPAGNLSFGVTIGHYEDGAYVPDEVLEVLP
jgi:branched-chain amino acid transport system substrate-binding protein